MAGLLLKFIDRGTIFDVQREADDKTFEKGIKAVFYDLDSDTSFLAESSELINKFEENAKVKITFAIQAQLYTFFARTKKVLQKGSVALVLIEQISCIETTTRREFERYEMRLDAKLYGLLEDLSVTGGFKKADENPVFSAETFDISATGLCLVSNRQLSSPYEPMFLAEFSFPRGEQFLLPAKLLRKSKCTKTVVFRYDYGLLFIYDAIPKEKDRLINAIFNARLSQFSR